MSRLLQVPYRILDSLVKSEIVCSVSITKQVRRQPDATASYNATDTDMDGIPDVADLDDDNDGVTNDKDLCNNTL